VLRIQLLAAQSPHGFQGSFDASEGEGQHADVRGGFWKQGSLLGYHLGYSGSTYLTTCLSLLKSDLNNCQLVVETKSAEPEVGDISAQQSIAMNCLGKLNGRA